MTMLFDSSFKIIDYVHRSLYKKIVRKNHLLFGGSENNTTLLWKHIKCSRSFTAIHLNNSSHCLGFKKI